MRATQRSTERLLRDLKIIVRDGEDLLRAIPEDLGGTARDARQRLAAALENAKTRYEELEGRAIAGARAVDETVHESPYYFIGAAFGLGLLAGFLMSRS